MLFCTSLPTSTCSFPEEKQITVVQNGKVKALPTLKQLQTVLLHFPKQQHEENCKQKMMTPAAHNFVLLLCCYTSVNILKRLTNFMCSTAVWQT